VVEPQRHAFNAAMIGRRLDVLFEKSGRHPGQIGGKTPYLHAVHVMGDQSLIGQVVQVDIIEDSTNSLHGRLVGGAGSGAPAWEKN
jgi:tRNA-2-methylthio-N6-dimethylallyladenosine synthase